jgi:hypothetical protein
MQSAVGLTDQEKVRCRHHMGYLNVAEVYTFVLGTPAGVETQFLIEGAMTRVLAAALPLLRRHLDILDTIETQMIEDLDVMVATQVGGISINKDEQKQLVDRYDYWVDSLANVLGCTRNPFDKRKFNPSGGSRINARVG